MRYHKDVGFPDTIDWPNMISNLGYTKHAQIRKKRHNQFKISRLPSSVKVCKETIVEVHTDDNINITKAVVITRYTDTKNMALVLQLHLPKTNATVITVWINKKEDNGKLKNFKYDIPEPEK